MREILEADLVLFQELEWSGEVSLYGGFPPEEGIDDPEAEFADTIDMDTIGETAACPMCKGIKALPEFLWASSSEQVPPHSDHRGDVGHRKSCALAKRIEHLSTVLT